MESLDPAVEELRKAGDLLDLENRHLGGAQGGSGASGRDDLPAELNQALREGDYPPLVTHRDQSSRHGAESGVGS
jgi:hypothetical protein